MKRLTSLIALTLLSYSAGSLANGVNINTADPQTLAEQINGIGLTKAQAIVDYREQHGRFNSIDELTRVKGIGDKTLERNRQNLSLRDTAQ